MEIREVVVVDVRKTWRRADRWRIISNTLLVAAVVQLGSGLVMLGTIPAPFLLGGGVLASIGAHTSARQSRQLQRRAVLTLYRKDGDEPDPDRG